MHDQSGPIAGREGIHHDDCWNVKMVFAQMRLMLCLETQNSSPMGLIASQSWLDFAALKPILQLRASRFATLFHSLAGWLHCQMVIEP